MKLSVPPPQTQEYMYFSDEDSEYAYASGVSSQTQHDSSDDDQGSEFNGGPEFWEVNEKDLLEDFNPDNAGEQAENQHPHHSALKTVRWVLLFLLLWASFYGISANALDNLVHFFHYLFSSLSQNSTFIASLAVFFLHPTTL